MLQEKSTIATLLWGWWASLKSV